MSQRTILVTYVYRKKVPSSFRAGEWVYQLSIVTEARLAGPGEFDPEPVLHKAHADAAGRLSAHLREASARSAAESIEGAIWRVWQTSNDLTLVQAANFLTGMSDSLHEAVQSSLQGLEDAAHVSAPVNLAGADVLATLLTGPIAEPVEDLEHGLELAGVFIGLVTGLHPLVMICAKYLIHDKISSELAKALDSALDVLFKGLGRAFGVEAHSVKAAAPAKADLKRVKRAVLLQHWLGMAINRPQALEGLQAHDACQQETAVSHAASAITTY